MVRMSSVTMIGPHGGPAGVGRAGTVATIDRFVHECGWKKLRDQGESFSK
jgi:hypothetical protein